MAEQRESFADQAKEKFTSDEIDDPLFDIQNAAKKISIAGSAYQTYDEWADKDFEISKAEVVSKGLALVGECAAEIVSFAKDPITG
ncbi:MULTISPECIES: hypothetical protein [Thermocrispum]|jgi:hypothetical protein|uniref:Uncharacterized protein n=1 Tax=Thermocrispum agreste TaxID=37925 RepID=A0A2W4JQV1_9PSEU|nr:MULTISPECIES: hypothetical protein [Thermocrispum]PZN00106.1 MAG: hypothetical protein DIU77_04290 [Thermocrispum agreste]